MKKKILIITLCLLLVLAVLLVPIPQSPLRDGGTQVYSALAYKVVKWNRLTDDSIYQKTCVYWLADRYKSLEELWEEENPREADRYNTVTEPGEALSTENDGQFTAKILEIGDKWALVEPVEGEWERNSCSQLTFGTASLDKLDAQVGDYVLITYDGQIMESFPGQIHASGWSFARDLRQFPYEKQWLDPETTKEYEYFLNTELTIDAIYADCFIATPVIPMPYRIKVNGQISEKWCPGDQVAITYKNCRCDERGDYMEVDLLHIEAGTLQLEPGMAYKPVLYLYPEQEQDVAVKLMPKGGFTCTYPAYEDGWQVTASPDGTLTDKKGQTYNYLYWEGRTGADYDLSRGFCVRGEDTAAFLEEALEKLGLNRTEANEFIVYWLPLMQDNPYNIISFQQEAYTNGAPLEITPAPDTLIRVFMTYRPSDTLVDLPPQTFTAPERTGFTAIEWGGTKVG